MKRVCMGLFAHVDAGKTTLSEALLYKCAIIRRLGRVDKKDAFLDNYAMERERGITIFSKQACFTCNGVEFTLIDTPGHVDFSTEMERTLSVLDAAILVISGTDGVQAHTRTIWKLLRIYDIPTVIFVNKMDRTDSDRSLIREELKAELGAECTDFEWENNPVSGGLQLTNDTCERIALEDEELMEKYLETGAVSADDIRFLIEERRIFPCIYGSALKLEGIDQLLECLSGYAPGYDYDEDSSGDTRDSREDLSARIYKITRSEDGARLTHLKITGGVLKNRDLISYSAVESMSPFSRSGFDRSGTGNEENRHEEVSEKITQLRVYSGEKYETVDCAYPGMIVAAVGLSATYAGQTLGNEEEVFTPELVPVMTYRVVTADKSHLMQLVPKLKTLEEEDPSLNVIWNPEVRELQIRVMGDIQLEIISRTLKDRFGEDVSFDKGSVLYKETIAAPTLGVGHFEPLRHYAEVQLMLSPGERGSGITASSSVSVNDLELNWQRLIMTHIFEREHKGVLLGTVLTDVHVELVAGRAHIKHTEGGDFRQATYRAVRQGLMRARESGNCVILEPYYELTVELPRTSCGRAMTDIEKRSGKITSQYEIGSNDMVGLTGIAPVATMQGYVKEVSAYTKGLGSVYCSFYGYLPCHNSEEVIAAFKYDSSADLRNPASSVFCAHGAGFTVEWNDVDSYKHLDWDPKTGQIRSEQEGEQNGAVNFVSHASDDIWLGTEEIDAIINRTAYGNRREQTYRNPFRRKHSAVPKGTQIPNSGASRDSTDSFGKNGRDVHNELLKDGYILVDGYNIIFAWPELRDLAAVNVDGARERLNEILCDYQAVRGGSLIVVYDAYRVAGHPTEYLKYHNIGIVYTKEAETADRYIERFAHENAKKYRITVATSDGLEQIIIRGAGCRLMTALDLANEIADMREELRSRFNDVPGQAVGISVGTRIGSLLE